MIITPICAHPLQTVTNTCLRNYYELHFDSTLHYIRSSYAYATLNYATSVNYYLSTLTIYELYVLRIFTHGTTQHYSIYVTYEPTEELIPQFYESN